MGIGLPQTTTEKPVNLKPKQPLGAMNPGRKITPVPVYYSAAPRMSQEQAKANFKNFMKSRMSSQKNNQLGTGSSQYVRLSNNPNQL